MKAMDFFTEQTKELAKPVYDFIGTLAVYEGEADKESDKQCRDAYYKALDAVKIWLRLLELLGMMEAEYMESVTVLHLPEDDIRINVSTRTFAVSGTDGGGEKAFHSEIPGFDPGCRELIATPIGEMGSTTLTYILGVEDNPVKLLYGHLGDILHCIHNILSMPLHDEVPADAILTAELLEEHGIQDVLGVYKMDKILFDIYDFFHRQA